MYLSSVPLLSGSEMYLYEAGSSAYHLKAGETTQLCSVRAQNAMMCDDSLLIGRTTLLPSQANLAVDTTGHISKYFNSIKLCSVIICKDFPK